MKQKGKEAAESSVRVPVNVVEDPVDGDALLARLYRLVLARPDALRALQDAEAQAVLTTVADRLGERA